MSALPRVFTERQTDSSLLNTREWLGGQRSRFIFLEEKNVRKHEKGIYQHGELVFAGA